MEAHKKVAIAVTVIATVAFAMVVNREPPDPYENEGARRSSRSTRQASAAGAPAWGLHVSFTAADGGYASHIPAIRDALADALSDAMGEPVRSMAASDDGELGTIAAEIVAEFEDYAGADPRSGRSRLLTSLAVTFDISKADSVGAWDGVHTCASERAAPRSYTTNGSVELRRMKSMAREVVEQLRRDIGR